MNLYSMLFKQKFFICAFLGLFLSLDSSLLPGISRYYSVMAQEQITKAPKEEVDLLLQQGIRQLQTGQFPEAIESLQKSLKIAREFQYYLEESQALINLAYTYSALKNYDEALKYFQQSLPLLQNFKLALSVASEIKHPSADGAEAIGGLGDIDVMRGEYEQAITTYQLALQLRQKNDSSQIDTILGSLGIAYYASGNYQEAITNYQDALKFARQNQDFHVQWKILNNLGAALFKLGNLATAEKYLIQAIQVGESLRKSLGTRDIDKVSFFDELQRSYLILQKTLIAQNKNLEALEISERGRARAFVELLASRLQDDSDNSISTNPLKIEQIQQIARQQNATLVEYSIVEDNLYIWVINPKGEITFKSIELNIPGKLALTDTHTLLRSSQPSPVAEWVENNRDSISNNPETTETITYHRGDLVILKDNEENGLKEPYQVIAFDPKTNTVTVTHPQFDGAEISRPISDILNKVDSTHRTKHENLQQLYQQLIAPIESLLPSNPEERVIFIPHQELFLIPFAALQDSNGIYLIEKHTILTAPSIQVLQLTHQLKTKQQDYDREAVVVGNPTMPTIPLTEPPQTLSPLPGAEEEAKQIASLLGVKPLLGQQATKAEVVKSMSSAKLIHFATHGLLDDIKQLGTPGAIALAPTSDDEGFLTSGELINMKLKANLVVLSACNTGGGNITGDGIIGLSRSLITAGVKSVMVSLWSIPDAPTAELMSQFYDNYLNQEMNKAQALRSAMLSMIEQGANPKDWAGFTLIGEVE
jgi:CHAT domain-containing protein/Flp pilus assembly protein TadD